MTDYKSGREALENVQHPFYHLAFDDRTVHSCVILWSVCMCSYTARVRVDLMECQCGPGLSGARLGCGPGVPRSNALTPRTGSPRRSPGARAHAAQRTERRKGRALRTSTKCTRPQMCVCPPPPRLKINTCKHTPTHTWEHTPVVLCCSKRNEEHMTQIRCGVWPLSGQKRPTERDDEGRGLKLPLPAGPLHQQSWGLHPASPRCVSWFKIP